MLRMMHNPYVSNTLPSLIIVILTQQVSLITLTDSTFKMQKPICIKLSIGLIHLESNVSNNWANTTAHLVAMGQA